jgi:thiol-disulfide isomerase/thioredoxin
MLYKLSALLVAWHCFAPAYTQSLQPQTVKISATLIHADSTTPKAMTFNFLNPFIRNRKSAAFDEHNRLSSSEEMVFTQNMTIQYNDGFINLLVSPGDSVHLLIDGAQLKAKDFGWLTITGDHAEASTQLNKWHRFFSTHISKTFQPANTTSAMTDSARMEYARCMNVLDSYATVNPLLPEVRTWAANDIRFTVSYWAADYLTTRDSLTGKFNFHHALYAGELFDQYNPSGFRSMMFPYHLSSYAYTLTKTDSSIATLQQQMRYREAAEKVLALLSKEPAGLSRDYMLFYLVSSNLSRSPRLIDSLPGLAPLFSDRSAYAYLLKAADQLRNPSVKETPIAGLLYLNKNRPVSIPPAGILSWFSRQYPGKIVYIDVYATWCVPCLQEMDQLPAIKAKVDTAKIVFVNLCLQSDKEAWLALVKKRNLTGENYFLGEDATKLFMGMYSIEGFPSYLLLDQHGKLQTLKAPRPSDGDILIRAFGNLSK